MPLYSESYSCDNPEIPAYAPEPPAQSCQDYINRPVFYTPPSSGGKPTEVIAGDQIMVEDLSDADTYRFRVNYDPHVDLSTDLGTLAPFIAGVSALLNGLVLFGRTVDRVDLTWTHSKDVTTQSVSSSLPGFDPPVLAPAERTKSLTGLAITEDRSFTITGDDGEAQDGSIDSDTEFVRYGNYVRWGKGADLLNGSSASLQALFDGLASSINTNTRARSFFAIGGVAEHEYYLVPARFGEVTFQKGIFVGGFVRLKNVDGTLYQTLPDGETEDEILINNGYASENYYVYMSLYDNQADAVTPIVAS